MVDIVCAKCGHMIANSKMIRPVREVLSSSGGKCPSCGQQLSSSEFRLDVRDASDPQNSD